VCLQRWRWCFGPRRALALILCREAQGPFGAAVLGASMVGGPDRHYGLVMETTLVVWRSLGVSDLHGGGREGVESGGGGKFLSGMFRLWRSCGGRLQEALAAAFIVLVEV
jgi:hypothetical protein